MAFWKNIDDSAPFLRVPLPVVFVRNFPEEALKLSENLILIYMRAGGFLSPVFSAFYAVVAGLMIV